MFIPKYGGTKCTERNIWEVNDWRHVYIYIYIYIYIHTYLYIHSMNYVSQRHIIIWTNGSWSDIISFQYIYKYTLYTCINDIIQYNINPTMFWGLVAGCTVQCVVLAKVHYTRSITLVATLGNSPEWHIWLQRLNMHLNTFQTILNN